MRFKLFPDSQEEDYGFSEICYTKLRRVESQKTTILFASDFVSGKEATLYKGKITLHRLIHVAYLFSIHFSTGYQENMSGGILSIYLFLLLPLGA
jgi:cyanate permease